MFVDGGGTFTMSGGKISDCSAKSGGGVSINEGSFIMSGESSITNCRAYAENGVASIGGGVIVGGSGCTFTMSGGKISECSAFDAGGVSVGSGTFTMSGESSITNCRASNDGGGVTVFGMFTMSDSSSITNCSSEYYGGGVSVWGTFTMSDSSTISGCSATEFGGGVFVSSGLELGCRFDVSGTANIVGNTKDDSSNNVYLMQSNYLNLIDDFTGSIGISYAGSAPSAGATFGSITGSYSGAENIFADTDSTLVGKKDGTSLVWQKIGGNNYAVTITSTPGGSASASVSSAAAGTEIILTATPDSGYVFERWQVVKGSVSITEDKFTMPAEDVEVKAVFKAAGSSPAVIASDTIGGLTWTLYEDGELVISGEGEIPDCSSPDYAPWYPYRNLILSVEIGSGVTSIGNWAFSGCSNLANINVSEANQNYKSIDGVLFSKDYSYLYLYPVGKEFSSYTIPSGVTNICGFAFRECENLSSIVISSNVKNIEVCAFSGCSNLNSVIFSDVSQLTTIGRQAFIMCNNLTAIAIPSSVTSIGESAFEDCIRLASISVAEGNQNYKSIEGVLFSEDGALLHTYPAGKSSVSYTIPNHVTTLGPYAFQHCSNLKSIVIPSGVTSIGSNVFQYCSSLESIVIPPGVTSIESNVFEDCSSLVSISLPNGVVSIGYAAFSNCNSLSTIELPSSVTSIDRNAFASCSNLESIVIPVGVITIEDCVFFGCDNLKSIDIPSSVTSIGYAAFAGCDKLSSINLPSSIKSISESAFKLFTKNSIIYCTGTIAALLTSDNYSPGSTAIAVNNTDGSYKFTSAVTNLALSEANAPAGVAYGGWFKESSFTTQVESIPANENPTLWLKGDSSPAVTARGTTGDLSWVLYEDGKLVISGEGAMPDYSYGGEAPWYQYRDAITALVIKSGVTKINNYVSYSCDLLISIDIPSSVTYISPYAFTDCSSLVSINVDKENMNYKDIDGVLFSIDGTLLHTYPAGKSATTYEIPASVTDIGGDAFEGCCSFTFIDIPSSVRKIGFGAFSECTGLTSVTFAEDSQLTNIDVCAFSQCSNLSSIKIPSCVTHIGYEAFWSCSNLTSIIVDDGNKNYTDYDGVLFSYDGTLLHTYPLGKLETTYDIPTGVTHIENHAFDGCISLTSIGIPSTVTNIGYCAFSYCNNLASIVIPSSVIKIGEFAFSSLAENSIIYCSDANLLSGNYWTDQTALAVNNTNGSYSFTSAVTNLDLSEANAPAGVTYGGWFKEETFITQVESIPANENPTLWLKTDKETGSGLIIDSPDKWSEETLNSATGTVYVTGNWVLQPLYQNEYSWILPGDVTLDFSGFTGTFAGITDGTGCNSAVIGSISSDNGYTLIINNAHLKDVQIESCGGNVGGLIGRSDSANVIAVGCTITDRSISGGYSVGGLVGSAYSANVTADGCSVLNCDISGVSDVGGFIGNAYSTCVATDECSILSCNISGSVDVGGLVGKAEFASVVDADKCNVAGCSISGEGAVGGLVGLSYSAGVTADECSVLNCDISGEDSVGGLVGGITNNEGVITINECRVSNSGISGGDSNSVGGLIGDVSSASVTADGCSVSDCSISANNPVGGLIGAAFTSASVTADECSVLNCTISGELYVGGLVGITSDEGVVTVDGCSVADCNILGVSPLEISDAVGVLVGYVDSGSSIDGGSGEVNVLKNCSINSGVFLGKVIGSVGTVSLIGNNPIYVSLEDVTGATALVGGRDDVEFNSRIIVVSSTAETLMLESSTNEVVQGSHALICLTAPVGIWSVSVEGGMIPDAQVNVNNIENRDGLCYADITVPSLGVATFAVKSTSTLDIKVTLYNQGSTDTIAKSLIINVVTGAITAAAESSSVYLGDKFEVSGTNDFGGTLYLFIEGLNYPLSPIQKNEVPLMATGKDWAVTVDTSQIRNNGKKADAGKYTIYAVKLADDVTVNQISDVGDFGNEELVYGYDTVSIGFMQQFISLTKTPTVLLQGDKFEATGEATGSPDEVMYYIFGTNYFKYGTSSVSNREFTVELFEDETKEEKMATGLYFLVVQHPMYDRLFNIGPVNDGRSPYTYDIVLNERGAFNDGDYSILFNVNNRQTANAAQALCDALDSQKIDDTHVKTMFFVEEPSSIIYALPPQIVKGQVLTVSGTTVGYVGQAVTVELLSTGSPVAQTTTIGESGVWVVSFDTSTLDIGEYTCSVKVGQLDAATMKITVVDGPIVVPPTTEGFENLVVSPSGFLYPGETVTASVDLIIPKGTADTESTISLTSPLNGASWNINIFKGDTLVSTKHLASSSSYIPGYDFNYDADVTIGIEVTGIVSTTSFDTEISVLQITKSGITDQYAESYSSPKQYVMNTYAGATTGFTVNPSGSLVTGDKVTASVEIKLPRDSVDIASKLYLNTPLVGDTWIVDIMAGNRILNTKHLAKPHLDVSGFDLDYDSDVTVRVGVTGTVPSKSAGKDISVLEITKSGMHDSGPQKYSSPKQHVYSGGNLNIELAALDKAIKDLDSRIAYYQSKKRDVGQAQTYANQARTKYNAAVAAGTADVLTAFANIEDGYKFVKQAQRELALAAQLTAKTYTITLDGNGGTVSPSTLETQYGNLVKLPKATRSNHIHIGWAVSKSGSAIYAAEQEIEDLGDVTLYAVWTPESHAYDLTVNVMNAGGSAASGAKVELKQGSATLQTATATSEGSVTFTNVPEGIYTLVAADKDDTRTITKSVTVTKKLEETITLPAKKVKSEVEVSTKNGTPAIAVDGIAEIAEALAVGDEPVTVKVSVETKTEDSESGVEIKNIKENAAPGLALQFIGINIEMSVNGAAPEGVSSTPKVLEFIIPYDFNGKNIKLYRYHKGTVTELTELSKMPKPSERADGTFWADTGNQRIYLYADQFSTYAIGVSEPQEEQPTSSSGSSRDTGSSIWLPVTAEPTAAPTAEPTQAQPTASPIQPAPQASTPAPFIGILAGLGAAAVFFGLRRR